MRAQVVGSFREGRQGAVSALLGLLGITALVVDTRPGVALLARRWAESASVPVVPGPAETVILIGDADDEYLQELIITMALPLPARHGG